MPIHEGCEFSVAGGSKQVFCTSHSGGRRCKYKGCEKGSVLSYDLCKYHGNHLAVMCTYVMGLLSKRYNKKTCIMIHLVVVGDCPEIIRA
mmetsp:Transcript_11035/g.18077  ORF Transcript_11035/g.18077 Transcript_11035/m.18077 type:complete len:90 (+) Transcript_11035:220-489(+)